MGACLNFSLKHAEASMSIPTLIPVHTQSLVVALPISADIDTNPTFSWIGFQSVFGSDGVDREVIQQRRQGKFRV